MSDETLALDQDLGQATIVYEHPDEGTERRTVENEQIAYFQDHWLLKAGEDDDGNDIVRRIPKEKVYHVDRSVEEFEEEVKTIRNQVQSMAKDLRTKLPIGGGNDEEDRFDDEDDPQRL